jgi:hypothetical protein
METIRIAMQSNPKWCAIEHVNHLGLAITCFGSCGELLELPDVK